jgi:hypothetical protein
MWCSGGRPSRWMRSHAAYMGKLAALGWVLCLPVQTAHAVAGTSLLVSYPQKQAPVDAYFIDMLKLALAKSGVPHSLRAWDTKLVKGRALHELVSGTNVDVVWAGTSRDREKNALPIRIPLDMGLAGWRIALIRQQDAARFQSVQTLEHLKSLTAGQGYDWFDTRVMKANGLPVTTGTNFENLFSMLMVGRYDYLPRSIRQIWDEAEQHAGQGVVVEQNLLLHYPAAVYFFVHPKNTALATALETGLRKARKDGSFGELFREFGGEFIDRANLGKRRVIELANPDLPDETPLAQKDLWFTPDSSAAQKPVRR